LRASRQGLKPDALTTAKDQAWLARSEAPSLSPFLQEEVERQSLREGQLSAVEVVPAEVRPVLSPALREAFEESWKHNEAGYRYLAEH